MEQKTYIVEYLKEKQYRIYDSKTDRFKWKKELEVIECILPAIKESEIRHQIIKKMPHPMARDKAIKLWKFFVQFVNGKPIQLNNPRYMIQIGHHWFKIRSIKIGSMESNPIIEEF